jgi:putative (di)nucleoside polyphosphate hydrolase
MDPSQPLHITPELLNPAPGAPSRDLDLTALLDSPEVRLPMEVDGVDRDELKAMLDSVKVALGNHEQTDQKFDEARYRPGLGMVLVNAQRKIFIAQRNDVAHPAWQMPQGGIEPGEEPREAALRELREEIGTNNVVSAAEASHWIHYDVPARLAKQAWRERWLGQRHRWFLMEFKGGDDEIDLATPVSEFSAWRRSTPQALIGIVAPFKRRLYEAVFAQFDTYFRG